MLHTTVFLTLGIGYPRLHFCLLPFLFSSVWLDRPHDGDPKLTVEFRVFIFYSESRCIRVF
uniref:Uncharacterized protein n=1 Tax=Arundo donax TaxID=35708 RepID=A0A0A9G5Z5_ARUDO